MWHNALNALLESLALVGGLFVIFIVALAVAYVSSIIFRAAVVAVQMVAERTRYRIRCRRIRKVLGIRRIKTHG